MNETKHRHLIVSVILVSGMDALQKVVGEGGYFIAVVKLYLK